MVSDTDLPISIAEQATHWWVIVNSEDCPESDLAAFSIWVTQSPERISAYLRTSMLVKASKSSAIRWPATSAAALAREAKASIGSAPQVSHESWRPAAAAPRAVWFGISRRLAFATMTAVAGAVAIIWFVTAGAQVFQTGFGERRSILLADGTRITLNTESKIEVGLRKDRRTVSLLSGEALFSVAHDPQRIFEVKVGGAEIRDVGTQFDVDRRSDRTTITVVEGRIAVAPEPYPVPPANHGAPRLPGSLLLEASDQLVITPSEWHAPQRGVDLRAAVAWTENKLIFAHTPLVEAVEEFNRYNRQRIRIEGARLQRQEITGTFRSDDPLSFLSFLSSVPGISIHDGPDGTHDVRQN